MFGKLEEEAPFIKAGLPLGGVDADGAPLVCRICFEESEDTADLISPCRCKGAWGMPVDVAWCARAWQLCSSNMSITPPHCDV